MSDYNMTSLASKLQHLQLCLKSRCDQELGYGLALREAIIRSDHLMEVEVLKSLGDLHLEKGKLSKDLAEFDKAGGLYAAALLRCFEDQDHYYADQCETLGHRQIYLEKLSKQLLPGFNPTLPKLPPKSARGVSNNVLRVAEICEKLDRSIRKSKRSVEAIYTETLVTAIGNYDVSLEFEVLKSLGDFYLENGTKAKDVVQFDKAAAMYNKALTICENPDTEETIIQRILYTDKIRNAVKRKTLRNPRGGKAKVRHPTDQSSQYQDHLMKGDKCLHEADHDSAEQHFAAALKIVHVRDPTVQQYQREVEPLCKLGDVYSKRGQQTGDGGDFVKAAALYNAAIARSEDQVLNGNIETAIREIDKLFLQCILDVHCVAQNKTDKHKKQLKEMRDQIKLKMETIDQQLDPYVHDEKDPCVREIEAKRAQAVRQLFEKIAQQRKEFISLLIEECIGLMGPPPCKYALIGLGSQATGLVTPYSDLEFAILVEEESQECLVYFRNLTYYLHLKVVNLGETILPALGIRSLNDFYSKNPLDNWYYDSVTPRGFAFDGFMPKASKTPLGRQGTKNKPPSELICTPENMVVVLQNDATLYLKEGYHLATILRNPCLIAGDQDLIDTYMNITVEILKADGGKMAQQLADETLGGTITSYDDKATITGRLINVKKELYRFPAVSVDCLALSSGIIPTTIWKTIDEMRIEKVVDVENAHHLKVLVSISAELRLRTYFANGGQRENLSALHGQETSMQANDGIPISVLKQVFYLPNKQQFLRYYYTAIPLKSFLSTGSEKRLVSDFYDTSPGVRGKVHLDLCRFRTARDYFDQALKMAKNNESERINLLPDLAVACYQLGDLKNAIRYQEEFLNTIESRCVIWRMDSRPAISTILNNLGMACQEYGDYNKAIQYYEKELQFQRNIHGMYEAHPDIALKLCCLGEAWGKMGDHRKAKEYEEQAIQMCRNIHEKDNIHLNTVSLLDHVGCIWLRRGDNKKAISYFEKALQMLRNIFGESMVHPNIAALLYHLGHAWCEMGDSLRAITYSEEALQMFRNQFGLEHPRYAHTLNTLGSAYRDLGNYTKAITYHEEALDVWNTIYGQGTANIKTADTLGMLGQDYMGLRDYSKAVTYQKKALKMKKCVYGQDEEHCDIAMSISNLGATCSFKGDHKEAIRYLEQGLQMYRSIYGQNTKHRDIATCLRNLGKACENSGDLKKAVCCYEEMLEMFKSIHGPTTEHPDIADSFDVLGRVYQNLGDHGKSISYHEKALDMYRKVYGQSTAHPCIAKTLSNLGAAWNSLGAHRKTSSYMSHENMYCMVQKMIRHILGQDIESPDDPEIPWAGLEDHKKALFYLEQALQMLRRYFGQEFQHRDIATLLSNLGQTLSLLGNHEEAYSYEEQSFDMRRSMYGHCAVHPDIAISLLNLGGAKIFLGDHEAAMSLLQKGLAMCNKLPPEQKSKELFFLEDTFAEICPDPGTDTISET
ncbi:uncharacterized protein LOC144927985 [Branchiostoma floridae x Branchiostoma belcheri]